MCNMQLLNMNVKDSSKYIMSDFKTIIAPTAIIKHTFFNDQVFILKGPKN
jgi:hypothetical protein